MSNFFPAVQSVGRPVLIIKNNEVVGKGTASVMRGNDFVAIQFKEGPIMDMVAELETVKVLGHKHSLFHYYPASGLYKGRQYAEGFDEPEYEVLGDTSVVDEFNFGYGMVPDIYDQVAGCRKAMLDVTDSLPESA